MFDEFKAIMNRDHKTIQAMAEYQSWCRKNLFEMEGYTYDGIIPFTIIAFSVILALALVT